MLILLANPHLALQKLGSSSQLVMPVVFSRRATTHSRVKTAATVPPPQHGYRFFFMFFLTSLMTYVIFRLCLHLEGTRKMRMRSDDENGPKRDTSGVVWALGDFFFLYFVFFLILTIFYCIYRL